MLTPGFQRKISHKRSAFPGQNFFPSVRRKALYHQKNDIRLDRQGIHFAKVFVCLIGTPEVVVHFAATRPLFSIPLRSTYQYLDAKNGHIIWLSSHFPTALYEVALVTLSYLFFICNQKKQKSRSAFTIPNAEAEAISGANHLKGRYS